MIVADQPLAEKLAWFWHGHFATSVQKIKVPKLMVEQLSVFREKGAGQWEALVQAASQDPAMLIWLDARQNVAAHPNENFARELFELFTLGIGHYTEADVKESARAFTGWSLDVELHPSFRPQVHDGGMKTVLGTTGPLKGEDVIRLATNHPGGDRFIASRMFSRFVRPITSDDPIAAELAGSFVSADRSVAALLKAVLLHPELRTEAGRTGLVKQPVEWLAGSMRALGLRPHPEDGGIVSALHAEGQVPFAPPSVGGWPANGAWLTSSAALARMQTAASLVAQPAAAPALDAVSGASAGDRVDAAAHLLSVSWSSATAAALAGQAGNPKTLVAAALSAPEYVLA